ncbi:MAG: mechanosensitive ion channel family protein [Reichenbachiella sp.]|uniref:mechanosensitive ion channel family protein n=1 Tax=Reichenbachiella sp. TaxID=2184521 RepID=UPI0032672BD6
MKDQILNNLENIAIFIGIVLATILVAFLVSRFFKQLIRRSTEVLKNDPTSYLFLGHSVKAIIYIVGFSLAIYMMPGLRVLANSLLAGAGVLALAVGFASQQALSNIISGIFIVIFKPYRINDRLKMGEKYGTVEDITLRHTVLRDLFNKRIIIPNSLISNEVIVNSDIGDDRICNRMEFGISYDSDIKKAKAIIKEEILNHPLHIDTRTKQEIELGEELAPVKVIGLGDSSVNLRGWAWAKDLSDAFNLECDLWESVKLRFDKEGIEIPFPHRTLVHKNSSDKKLN